MEVYEYLDQVEKQIRQEAVREEIRTELRQHIEDQADFYQESGMSRKEAVERAVEDMGDPVETGVQLDMVHQPQLDKKLLGVVTGILCLEAVIGMRADSPNPYVIACLIWLWASALRKIEHLQLDSLKNTFFFWLLFTVLGGAGCIIWGSNGPTWGLMLQSLIPMAFAVLAFWNRGERLGLWKLSAAALIGILASLFTESYLYIFLMAETHFLILHIAVSRKWYRVKRHWLYMSRIFWGIFTVAGIWGCFELWKEEKYMRILQKYLAGPDIPGVLKDIASELFLPGIFIWICCMAGIYIWMIVDIKKLTNDLCWITCTGVIISFAMTTVYSIGCLCGLGSEETVFFPIFSTASGTKGALSWIFCFMMGIFLNCHKSDRIIPRAKK